MYVVLLLQLSPCVKGSLSKRTLDKPPRCLKSHPAFGLASEDEIAELHKILIESIDEPTDVEGLDQDCLHFHPKVELFLILLLPKKVWPVQGFGWLNENHLRAGMYILMRRHKVNPYPNREGRIAFLDQPLTHQLYLARFNFNKDPNSYVFEDEIVGMFKGEEPLICPPGKQWIRDVDILYAAFNINDSHWVALQIDLPGRSIQVYDCDHSCNTFEKIKEYVSPFARMLPYLERQMATEESRSSVCLDPYAISRLDGLPSDKSSGSCGIYTLKFIECLAMASKDFSPLTLANMPPIRTRFAVDIQLELEPDEQMNPLDVGPRYTKIDPGEFEKATAAIKSAMPKQSSLVFNFKKGK